MSKTTPSRKTPERAMRPMTPRQIEAAAGHDPDNRPLSPDPARMKRTPQVKIIRHALGLSQEDFAARYRIPIGTLRDWEQGRATPDQAARDYLTVIARDPEAVCRTLGAALAEHVRMSQAPRRITLTLIRPARYSAAVRPAPPVP